ncbi:MAG: carotenoid biosynthesis protein [Candidatus Rokubacteria bacterium]|nr:carotenoid biosynthesis protein [Candidatus Rokubacteria bacterium]
MLRVISAMAGFVELAVGTVALRPYVFAFFLLFLFAAVAELGWRRAAALTGLAFGLAFAAEFSSTRTGIPFGLYHYTQATRGQELFLANVPLMDSPSPSPSSPTGPSAWPACCSPRPGRGRWWR